MRKLPISLILTILLCSVSFNTVPLILDVGANPETLWTYITPCADSLTFYQAPDNNFGTQTKLEVDNGGIGIKETLRSMLKFNLTGVSVSPTQIELRMFFNLQENLESNSTEVQVRKIANDSWTESTITWNIQEAYHPYGDLIDEYPNVAQNYRWMSWDVTDYVLDEMGGDDIASFLLKCRHEPDRDPWDNWHGYDFYSREKTQAQPELRIYYEGTRSSQNPSFKDNFNDNSFNSALWHNMTTGGLQEQNQVLNFSSGGGVNTEDSYDISNSEISFTVTSWLVDTYIYFYIDSHRWDEYFSYTDNYNLEFWVEDASHGWFYLNKQPYNASNSYVVEDLAAKSVTPTIKVKRVGTQIYFYEVYQGTEYAIYNETSILTTDFCYVHLYEDLGVEIDDFVFKKNWQSETIRQTNINLQNNLRPYIYSQNGTVQTLIWAASNSSLRFRIDGFSGDTSQIIIDTAGRLEPTTVYDATSWSYNSLTEEVTINVLHSSSKTIQILWVAPESFVSLIRGNYYVVFALVGIMPLTFGALLIIGILKNKETLEPNDITALIALVITMLIAFIIVYSFMNATIGG